MKLDVFASQFETLPSTFPGYRKYTKLILLFIPTTKIIPNVDKIHICHISEKMFCLINLIISAAVGD